MSDQQKDLYKDPETQQMLNTPVTDPTGANVKDKEFLSVIIKMIEEGKIVLYKPESIINHAYYSQLNEQQQGDVDLEAVNMLSALREVEGLWKLGYVDSFQMESLASRIRQTKERVEAKDGDVFIF